MPRSSSVISAKFKGAWTGFATAYGPYSMRSAEPSHGACVGWAGCAPSVRSDNRSMVDPRLGYEPILSELWTLYPAYLRGGSRDVRQGWQEAAHIGHAGGRAGVTGGSVPPASYRAPRRESRSIRSRSCAAAASALPRAPARRAERESWLVASEGIVGHRPLLVCRTGT
jgi:hypothetical protein